MVIYDMQSVESYFDGVEISKLDTSNKYLALVTSKDSRSYPSWYCLAFMSDDLFNQIKQDTKWMVRYSFKVIVDGLSHDDIEHLKFNLHTDPTMLNAYQIVGDDELATVVDEIHYHYKKKSQIYEGISTDNAKLNVQVSELEFKVETLQDFNNELTKRHEFMATRNFALQLENDELRKQVRNLTRQQSPDKRKGYVYILKVLNEDNLYKIGRTKNPDNRLKTFSVKLPFAVEYEHLIKTDDMYALEAELHERYKATRKNGSEFFTLTPDDIQAIKQTEGDS